jgi:hydroxypyruvate reductase
MALAVEQVLGSRVSDSWVNVKTGHSVPTRWIHLHEAGHPIPDEAGLNGTLEIARRLHGLTARDLVICLISGGGSALMTLPASPISLVDLQNTTDLLLRGGATINQLNAVRKHLDTIKGGGLARRAAPAQLVTLVLSDVIGDPLDVIASGPTVPDSSTFQDAWAVSEELGVWPRMPQSAQERLQRGRDGRVAETPKPGDASFAQSTTIVVGSNKQAAEAALRTAITQGWTTLDLGSMMEGEAREVGRTLGSLARSIALEGRPYARPACVIAGGETVVTVHGSGRGGRNQEVALGAAVALRDIPDAMVISFGTDGTDGPTDAAGAIADGTTLTRARALGLNQRDALTRNDSHHFFEALGDLLLTGPTRTNVNDLMFIFVGLPR